jgi:hypothetical protein
MDEARRRRQRTAEFAGMIVFFAVLVCGDWLGYAASIALFRSDPAAVPDGFHVVLAAPSTRGPGADYVPVGWSRLAEARTERGVTSYRLPEAAGSVPGPKTRFSFAVLEDNGARQIVEVRSDGLLTSRSRYEAYPDRVLPIGYHSYAWEYEQQRSLTALALMGLAAIAAAFGTAFAVNLALKRDVVGGGKEEAG